MIEKLQLYKILWAAILFGLLPACSLVKSTAEVAPDMRPLLSLTGTDSSVREVGFHLIRNTEDWVRLWQRHKGLKPTGRYNRTYNVIKLPEVNFDSCMLLAVFQGMQAQNAGLSVGKAEHRAEEIVIGFVNHSYSVDYGLYEPGKEIEREPELPVYAFFILPRSDKALVVEEAYYERKGESKKWHRRHRFSAFNQGPETKP